MSLAFFLKRGRRENFERSFTLFFSFQGDEFSSNFYPIKRFTCSKEILARNSFTSKPVTDPSHPCSTRGYIEGNKSVNSRRLKNKPYLYLISSAATWILALVSVPYLRFAHFIYSLIPTLSSSRCTTREQPITHGGYADIKTTR